MNFSTNKQKIDAYIKKHNSEESNAVLVQVQDKLKSLPVYRLPLDLLFYNIKNGRFASEYVEKTKAIGRELNSTKKKDSEIIEDILLSQDIGQTENLRSDLLSSGQLEAGIITEDGFLINGNRRKAVLTQLQDENSKFNYMLVARLPNNASKVDLWKIEAGLQLSRPTRLDYGPINTILKIKEGLDNGLKPAQISNLLYGVSEEQIIEDQEKFKLMLKYLTYIGKPYQYTELVGRDVHFTNLLPTLNWAKINLKDNYDLIKNIAFEIIFLKKNYFKIRNLRKFLVQQKSRKALLRCEEYLRETSTGRPSASLMVTYDHAEEAYKSISDDPSNKLDKIILNLESIDHKGKLKADTNNKSRLIKIQKETNRIMKLFHD